MIINNPRGRVYNRFVTPEKWGMVNNENKLIMYDFLEELKQQKKSKQTISQYENDLKIIFCYILEEKGNQSVLQLRKKDFRSLSIYFSEDKHLSANRVNRLKSCLNSMLTFCEEDEDYDYEINYAKKVRGLKRELVKTNENNFFVTFDEFIKVRDILVEHGNLRDAVLWSIMFDSGGRKNEIFQIEKKGLTESNKTNIVRGKRGKKFQLVYLDDTKELIKRYLEERGDDDIPSLWYKTHKGKKYPVTSGWIYSRIVAISSIVSKFRREECQIFPHTLRHSRAECLVSGTDNRLKDKDGNNKVYTLEQVMVFMHHDSVETTKSYVKNKDDNIINEMFGFDK